MVKSDWAFRMTNPPRMLPATRTYLVPLPLCALRVMEAGDGPPMVIVPATISELENWDALIQFMAQWFRVYFFELPGHGQSTPFKQKFTCELVAETVEQLVDHIGARRFNLMGFSFGGILAMTTFRRLHARIDRVTFMAPCLTSRAVMLSPIQKWIAQWFSRLLGTPRFRSFMLHVIHHPYSRGLLVTFMRIVGRVENPRSLDDKISHMDDSIMDVIACELKDILNANFSPPAVIHQTPCYFAMSSRDPLLDYQTTLAELERHFSNVHILKLNYPFHQPPRPFTFEELNRDFGTTVNLFLAEPLEVPAHHQRDVS